MHARENNRLLIYTLHTGVHTHRIASNQYTAHTNTSTPDRTPHMYVKEAGEALSWAEKNAHMVSSFFLLQYLKCFFSTQFFCIICEVPQALGLMGRNMKITNLASKCNSEKKKWSEKEYIQLTSCLDYLLWEISITINNIRDNPRHSIELLTLQPR